MTKSQIKAELRRSACGVSFPMFCHLSEEAFEVAESFLPFDRNFDFDDNGENKRIFFLLVAEAI